MPWATREYRGHGEARRWRINVRRDRLGTAVIGLGLVALGVVFLLAQWIGWSRIWPVFPVLGGLAFFGAYVSTGLRDGGFAFVGTLAVLVGLFFFGFSSGIWEWEEMSRLWPVFPFIGGVAFTVLFVAERRSRDVGTLGIGCAALIVGVVGLALTYGIVGRGIVRLWPLLLVLAGLFGLVSALWQGFRRE
jgi:hypothetical protein